MSEKDRLTREPPPPSSRIIVLHVEDSRVRVFPQITHFKHVNMSFFFVFFCSPSQNHESCEAFGDAPKPVQRSPPKVRTSPWSRNGHRDFYFKFRCSKEQIRSTAKRRKRAAGCRTEGWRVSLSNVPLLLV